MAIGKPRHPSSRKKLAKFPLIPNPPKPKERSLSAAMGGSRQKKSSGSSSSFSFSSLFKGHNKPRKADDMRDDFVKAYKVWPSDEDRGRWVAEPGIDRKATAFITERTEKWKSVVVAN